MAWTELATEVVDPTVRARAVRHLRQERVVLPSFAELADPVRIPASVVAALAAIDADAAISSACIGTTTSVARGWQPYPPISSCPRHSPG